MSMKEVLISDFELGTCQRRYCVVVEFFVFMSFGGVGRRCVAGE